MLLDFFTAASEVLFGVEFFLDFTGLRFDLFNFVADDF